MKIRSGFVSNSSSTSFYIRNTSKDTKTLMDFIMENQDLITKFNTEYDYNYTLDDLMKSVWYYEYTFPPETDVCCVFGDADNNPIGHVYDYILRNGGASLNFSWWFNEYLR